MHSTAALVASTDRQLEQLLGAQGLHVSQWSEGDLRRLADGALRPPDLLVLDLRDTPALPESLASVRKQFPHTAVVVVAPQLDPALMLSAMRAGVSEWVTAPVVAGDLQAAVQRVLTLKEPLPTGLVFAFLGAKGGVGATTVAVNVATVLTEMSAGKTLLVDLHSAYGDASVYLGAEPRFTVVDALENTHRLDEAFFQSLIVKGKGGPDLLASADQPAAGIGDTHRVRSLIEFASRHYQYVVLDCPRSDTAILDALEPAKAILIVVNQELATLRNGSRIATSLRQRFGRSRVMVVANRFDAAADIGHDDVERVVGSEVRHTIPSDYRQALAALNRGRPLVLGNGGKLGEALTGLAKALAGTEQGSGKAQDRQAGLFGRLLGKR